MYRSLRLARVVAPAAPRLVRAAGSRRLVSSSTSSSTASSSTPKRTWKGAALRWGAAGAALYWYNTSPVFADDVVVVPGSPLAAAAEAATQSDPSATGASSPVPEEHFRTVDSVLEEKQKEARRRAEAAKEEAAKEEAADGPEALEAEAGQQGAFNPETGEINWDCPCLGGMAHGPCGEDFKAAFSCFVFSTEEPKGMDCIEKFQHMQDCFRKYPEIYGAELQDDEEAEAGEAGAAPGDVTEDKPANGAPTKAQIAERLAEDAKAGEKAEEKPADTEAKPEVKPEAEAKPTESAEKPKKKTKAKKAKAKAEAKTEATAEATADKTATEQTQTESFPTAASDATASNAEPPAADDETSLLPKAAFDATGANK